MGGTAARSFAGEIREARPDDYTQMAELARQLMAELPQQMLPSHYKHLSEMPLSVTRKIDRRALRERASELFGPGRAAGTEEAAWTEEKDKSQRAEVQQ